MTVQAAGVSTDGAGQPPAPSAPVRPEGVPEKFWNAEKGVVDVTAMAKSYTELEGKLGAKPGETPAAPAAPAGPTVDSVLTKAGLTQAAITKEYLDNQGKLTPETIAKLAGAGVSEEQISTYVAGAKAQADKVVASITKAAGGPEKLQEVYAWAEANLSADEIAAYNTVLDGGNEKVAKITFEGLHARFLAANGQEPSLVSGDSVPTHTGPKPFASIAEQTRAIQDPRYQNDSAYRGEVEKRIIASSLLQTRGGR